ncbi:ABC transporter ATP-binding protein [Burkholderiales bacterium]|nr:ABC transporter ATP-binding protein [Burkholderiales bacterium]
MALIQFKNITKTYGTGDNAFPALKGLHLTIDEGEFLALMGPSGSGKSTTMNIAACLDTVTSGNYLFQNISVENLDTHQRTLLRRNFLGFIFQGFNLLPRSSALENVELPLIYRGDKIKERRSAAYEALEKVGLSDWRNHNPNELSGGQQQRVAIARAIVTNPKILLADEPTGNLDSQTSAEIMSLLTSLNQDSGVTIIMVTHEQEMADYASRVVHFLDGQIRT